MRGDDSSFPVDYVDVRTYIYFSSLLTFSNHNHYLSHHKSCVGIELFEERELRGLLHRERKKGTQNL